MDRFAELFELQTRILCDVRPKVMADAAFLFAQTRDNQASVFESAHRLLQQGLTSRILLTDVKSISGYPGFASWREQLLALGLKPGQIRGVSPGNTQTLNTLIEAKALIRFAKEQELATLIVTAAPFHQTRAFMTAVTVALTEYPHLQIYSVPGQVLPWHEEVSHSQGTTRGQRHALIKGELTRIERYQKKGDLAACSDILNYLNRRDC